MCMCMCGPPAGSVVRVHGRHGGQVGECGYGAGQRHALDIVRRERALRQPSVLARDARVRADGFALEAPQMELAEAAAAR